MNMTALNLIFALLAAGAVAGAMGVGFFAGGRTERREATVTELARGRELERDAA
jgi:hypothetical protein